MIEMMEKSLEEIRTVYGGFPLKINSLEAGTEALSGCEEEIVSAPELRDRVIRFTMTVCLCFDDDQLLEIAWDQGYDIDTAEEAWEVIPDAANAVYAMRVEIYLSDGDGRQYVKNVNITYCVLDEHRNPLDWDVYMDDIDEDYALGLIEVFLDAAVDAE